MFRHNLLLIFILSLFAGCKTWHDTAFQTKLYPIEDTIQPASAIDSLIFPYKKQLDTKMNTIIGQSAMVMEKGKPESLLGNWFADVMYEKAKERFNDSLDFAFQNFGGIRIPSLPKGNINIGKIYELMPFENYLVVIELDSATVQSLCDMIAARNGAPVSRHIRFGIANKKAVDIQINGAPLRNNRTYKVVLNNYIANGGDKCDFLKDKKRTELDILLRDAIIEYIKEKTAAGKQIQSKLNNRIYFVEE